MVQLCAHLFWSRPLEGDSKEGDEAPPVQPSDDKRALECLQVSEGYQESSCYAMLCELSPATQRIVQTWFYEQGLTSRSLLSVCLTHSFSSICYVLMCVVQRSLKIADACMQSSIHVELFVDILNRYLFLFAEVKKLHRLVVLSRPYLSVFFVCACLYLACYTAPYAGLFERALCGPGYGRAYINAYILRTQHTSF